MPLKLVYKKNDIENEERVNAPEDLQGLITTIRASFKGKLEQRFKIKYEDYDGDLIVLSSEEDYQSMLNMGVTEGGKSLKIIVSDTQDGGFLSKAEPDQKRESAPLPGNANPSAASKSLQKESTLDAALKKAESLSKNNPIDVQLKRNIEHAALNTIKNNIGTIAHVIKDNIIEQPFKARTVSKDIVLDTVKYLEHLINNLDGLDNESKGPITETLKTLTAQVQKLKDIPQAVQISKKDLKSGEPQVERMISSSKESVKSIGRENVQKKSEHKVEFIHEIRQRPFYLTSKDIVVYKTVSLKNTGNKPWPAVTQAISKGQITGTTADLGSVQPGKECEVVLAIDIPKRLGNFISVWSVICISENGEYEIVGEFEVEVKIQDSGESILKLEAQSNSKPKYSLDVTNMANVIQNILSEMDLDKICEVIIKNPKLNIEEVTDLLMNTE